MPASIIAHLPLTILGPLPSLITASESSQIVALLGLHSSTAIQHRLCLNSVNTDSSRASIRIDNSVVINETFGGERAFDFCWPLGLSVASDLMTEYGFRMTLLEYRKHFQPQQHDPIIITTCVDENFRPFYYQPEGLAG